MIREVKVENGWVRGLPAADPRITSYKGIPFAAPPVGENRWRAPQPCKDWDGVYEAYSFAPVSMQVAPGLDKNNIYSREWAVDPEIPMSEDCLYLNVWAPAQGQKDMPVFVWYFGGGLREGNTAEMEFDGERIARRGIVVVTVNYRLNVFGFMCHPEISKEAPDAPANFGFLDQQFGTQWVKRNIAAFGGDPNNITIGGQSAGGMSVGAQIDCPHNQGLFQRAIIESGLVSSFYAPQLPLNDTLEACEERGVRFFEYLGVKNLAEARAMDAKELLDKMVAWEDKSLWKTAIDGKFCVSNPFEWYRHDHRVKCPVMMGSTDSEFQSYPPAANEAELRAFAEKVPGLDVEKFMAGFSKPMTAESIKKDGVISGIDTGICLAAKCDPSAKYYMYQFGAEIPGWDNPGTFHSSDLWFFFETLAKCWRPFVGKHYDLARQMCDYWCNYFKTGDPNGKDITGRDLPWWPTLDMDQPVRMVFGDYARPEKWEHGDVMAQLVKTRV